MTVIYIKVFVRVAIPTCHIISVRIISPYKVSAYVYNLKHNIYNTHLPKLISHAHLLSLDLNSSALRIALP